MHTLSQKISTSWAQPALTIQTAGTPPGCLLMVFLCDGPSLYTHHGSSVGHIHSHTSLAHTPLPPFKRDIIPKMRLTYLQADIN